MESWGQRRILFTRLGPGQDVSAQALLSRAQLMPTSAGRCISFSHVWVSKNPFEFLEEARAHNPITVLGPMGLNNVAVS